MSEHTPSTWAAFAPDVLPQLTPEDDPAFWEAALDALFADADLLCRRSGRAIVARVGACSHWLRPHQTRWTADGGFAWPTGYGGPRFSRPGLPEFDWSVTRGWDAASASWGPVLGAADAGEVLFRVTLPTRTARHPQAAVHTLWTPGPPVSGKRPLLQCYGFRKKEGRWACTAYRGNERVYELAAGGPT